MSLACGVPDTPQRNRNKTAQIYRVGIMSLRPAELSAFMMLMFTNKAATTDAIVKPIKAALHTQF